MSNKNEETPDDLRFQRYVNDWSLTGRNPEGIRQARTVRPVSPETFHAHTSDKTLARSLYERLYALKELLK